VVLKGPQIYGDCARTWLPNLRGTHLFPYYLHCVYFPLDLAESGTVYQARLNEFEFFNRTAPWSSLTCQHKLGVNSLLWSLERLWDDVTQDMAMPVIG
jgi:hypothetical protein